MTIDSPSDSPNKNLNESEKNSNLEILNSDQNYGEKYQDHYLELYKLYVSTVEKISDRRQTTNSFFLTINTAVIASISYLQLGVEQGKSTDFYWLVSLAGIVSCYAWYRLIRSYKDINKGKFKIIHLIEKNLPLALYSAEWDVLEQGKNPKVYLEFTTIELLVPWIFLGIHTTVLIKIIPWKIFLHTIGFNFS